jgi:GTPase SAR1 family protein
MDKKKSGSSKFDIALIGAGAVGKSSILNRVQTGEFVENHDPTIESNTCI